MAVEWQWSGSGVGGEVTVEGEVEGVWSGSGAGCGGCGVAVKKGFAFSTYAVFVKCRVVEGDFYKKQLLM